MRMMSRGRHAFGKRHSMLLAAIVLASLGSLSETSVAFVQTTLCSGMRRAVPGTIRSCTLRKNRFAGKVPVVACSSSRTGTSTGAGGMAELLKVQREALPDRCPECYEQVVRTPAHGSRQQSPLRGALIHSGRMHANIRHCKTRKQAPKIPPPSKASRQPAHYYSIP